MTLWFALNTLLLPIAYLLGSIPSGYWAGQVLKGIDIREHGSGSTGATNVLRTLGTVPAVVVLLIDILKGAGAIALVYWAYSLPGFVQLAHANRYIVHDPDAPIPTLTDLLPSSWEWLLHAEFDPQAWLPWMVTLAGITALLGHSKSIFLNFTGGKSVATSLGVLLAINWIVGLGTLGVFLLVLALSRIVSISSISGAIAVSGLMLLTNQPLAYILFGIAGGFYVIWRHRSNIQRLLAGAEPRLGQKNTRKKQHTTIFSVDPSPDYQSFQILPRLSGEKIKTQQFLNSVKPCPARNQ